MHGAQCGAIYVVNEVDTTLCTSTLCTVQIHVVSGKDTTLCTSTLCRVHSVEQYVVGGVETLNVRTAAAAASVRCIQQYPTHHHHLHHHQDQHDHHPQQILCWDCF